jgi:hypothetical protein
VKCSDENGLLIPEPILFEIEPGPHAYTWTDSAPPKPPEETQAIPLLLTCEGSPFLLASDSAPSGEEESDVKETWP